MKNRPHPGLGTLLCLLAIAVIAAVYAGPVLALDGGIPESSAKTETRKTKTQRSARNTELRTVTVPDDARTLAEAYAMTAEGGTIQIRAGIYEMSEPLTIEKNLTLRGLGENPEDVLLAGKERSALSLRNASWDLRMAAAFWHTAKKFA
ncbi:MAG: hypothetical protein IJF17_08280 [Thermoguttaceae bacterium]|nr:hypothetical protein [Thermoguttaceae bacterium]